MNSSSLILLAFAAACLLAVLDWFAVARQSRRPRYVFKPLTMVAVIAAAGLIILLWPHDPWQAGAFLIGFLLSLAGDVFLLLPNDRFFIPGLVSFLLAHICYIVGLNPSPPPVASLLLVVPIAPVGIVLLTRIRAGLVASGHSRLLGPVALYSAVISLMLFSAWATLFRAGDGWVPLRQLLIVLGASLFFISDSALAWNRFVRPFRLGDLFVMVTYHLGQISLAASLLVSG